MIYIKKAILPLSIILFVIGFFTILIFAQKLGNVVDLSGNELKTKIENKDSFILVLERTGCTYCEDYKPIINTVAKENNIKIYKLNISKLNVDYKAFLKEVTDTDSTPTTLFIVDGKESVSNRLTGSISKNTLINRLKSLNYIEK